MISGVYTITSPSGGQYVGSAVNFSARWSVHKHHLARGTHHNAKLQNAANKYGIDGLRFDPILSCPRDLVLLYEQIAIDGLSPRYNIAPTAGNSLGYKHTEETKQKFKCRRKGQRTPEGTARIVAGFKGKKLSGDHAAKVQAAKIGVPRSDAAKANMSAVKIGVLNTGRSIPVRCIDTGAVYPSSAEAARLLVAQGVGKACASYIACAARGKFKSAYGLRWEFA